MFTSIQPILVSQRRISVQVWRGFASKLTNISDNDGIRRLILNNPAKRNALSLAMLNELKANLTENLNDIKCIILSHKGPAFSAGHDLSEMTTATGKEHHEKIFTTCSDVITSIIKLPVPVIAQVNGIAAAAGCQLAASCDIVIATDRSKFSTPGANVGLFCSTPGVAVSRAVPRKISSYMLLTGLPLSAQEALQCGLVSKICKEEELEAETMKIAEAICSKSAAVITLGKQFYYKQLEQDINSAYREGGKVMVDNLCLEDTQNGIKSFLGKTKPTWSHTDRKVV